jgi:hypothetical protein
MIAAQGRDKGVVSAFYMCEYPVFPKPFVKKAVFFLQWYLILFQN